MFKADTLSLKIITEIIHELYGYDFSNYSKVSLKRRLTHHANKRDMHSLADMIPPLINDPKFFSELLADLSITVTEMFRNPEFYRCFANKVIPKLKTYPYIKIWHAGCATGEEVYSMAILLYENEFLTRTQLYGTDFNPFAISAAKKGIYSCEHIEAYETNYNTAGGKSRLCNYFTEKYDLLKIKQSITNKIAFFEHDLATDYSFGDVEVIVCRNVLIYFDDHLKNRVLELFYNALVPNGYLCLGDKETLNSSQFKCVDSTARIYSKVAR